MRWGIVLYLGGVGLGLGLMIWWALRAYGRSPVNGPHVPRGYVGKGRLW